MPAILTHQAIMLLARERLQDIRDRLISRLGHAGVLTDLEFRILRLATHAHAMMSDADDMLDLRVLPPGPNAPEAPSREAIATPDTRDWPDGFGRGVSRYAVMGSMGPDIPGLAALLAPAQAVWFDTVHKGTPDPHREQVDARTTDMAMAIWTKASLALTNRPVGGPGPARALDQARNQIRAYVLGHLTHLAGDMIAHPFIMDVESHIPSRQTTRNPFSSETLKFTHKKTEGSLDSRVAVETFRRESPRSGQAWSAWWPTVDEVPPELFQGYQDALADVYRTGDARSKGLSEFEQSIANVTLQVPDADFFKDGYRSLTKAGVGIMYNWGYGSWLGFLSIGILPILATMPLAFALPNGSKMFFPPPPGEAVGERTWFEALTLPLAINALTPVIYGGVIASLTWRGVEGVLTAGLIGTAFSAVFAFVFLITLLAGDPGVGFRWAFLLVFPAAVGLVLFIAMLANNSRLEKHRQKLLLLLSVPFIVAGIVAVLTLVFGHFVSDEPGAITWGVLSGLIVIAGLLMLFLWLPKLARDAKLPENAPAFPARRPHHVRLFDRSSFFDRPNQRDNALHEAHYPSSTRPLLRLWWTGDGDLFIRPQRTHLEFRFTEDDGDQTKVRIIPAPITPMTQQQLASFLTQIVPDAAGVRGKLQCALVHADEDTVELPPGATFADHSDVVPEGEEEDAIDTPEFGRSEARAKFKKLSTENNDKSYVLYHAPKRAQSVRFDRLGPVPFDDRELQEVIGPGTIKGSETRITGKNTNFPLFFRVGDHIVFNGQAREITRIASRESLVIASPFRPAPENDEYSRLGSPGEESRGFPFIAQPKPRSGFGDAIMDVAGDVGALFCLAGASRMLDAIEAQVPELKGMLDPAGAAVPAVIGPVARVFRNWSLDRRQVEEWREAVLGGAVQDDLAAGQPGVPILLQLGWVQTLRQWLGMVDRHTESAVHAVRHPARPNDPSNLELSQAMARLLDMSQPVVVHRGP
jgi:hypothetical protein